MMFAETGDKHQGSGSRQSKTILSRVTPQSGAISVVRTWGCWRLEWLKLLLNVNGCCVVTRQDYVTGVISNIAE